MLRLRSLSISHRLFPSWLLHITVVVFPSSFFHLPLQLSDEALPICLFETAESRENTSCIQNGSKQHPSGSLFFSFGLWPCQCIGRWPEHYGQVWLLGYMAGRVSITTCHFTVCSSVKQDLFRSRRSPVLLPETRPVVWYGGPRTLSGHPPKEGLSTPNIPGMRSKPYFLSLYSHGIVLPFLDASCCYYDIVFA